MPASVAFTGVSVNPMDREVVLEDQTVLVRGGLLERIGGSATVPTAAVDRVVGVRVHQTRQWEAPVAVHDTIVRFEREPSFGFVTGSFEVQFDPESKPN